MAKTKAEAIAGAIDMLGQGLDEFDLGVDFVAREMDTADGNEFAAAYVAGMLEEAVLRLLQLTPVEERLAMVGEVQQMVLLTAIEITEV